MNINDLETGDLLLIADIQPGIFNYFLSMIRYATHSNYVHIGMVVIEPPFIKNPEYCNNKPIYVWESGFEGTPDPQDDKIKLGVQITPINTFINNYKTTSSNYKVIVRRLNNNKHIFTNSILNTIHKNVYGKPYDLNPIDWIKALFKKDLEAQKTSRFWCSALVGYIYTMCGVLGENNDWSILSPSDFSLDGENLEYSTTNTLQPTEYLLTE